MAPEPLSSDRALRIHLPAPNLSSQAEAGDVQMNRKLLKLAVIVLALGAAACSTNAGGYRSEAEIVARLKQMDKSEIALKLGAPNQRIAVDDTHETWTYDSALVSVVGGQCKVSISFDGTTVSAATVHSFDYSPLAYPMGSCSQIVGALD